MLFGKWRFINRLLKNKHDIRVYIIIILLIHSFKKYTLYWECTSCHWFSPFLFSLCRICLYAIGVAMNQMKLNHLIYYQILYNCLFVFRTQNVGNLRITLLSVLPVSVAESHHRRTHIDKKKREFGKSLSKYFLKKGQTIVLMCALLAAANNTILEIGLQDQICDGNPSCKRRCLGFGRLGLQKVAQWKYQFFWRCFNLSSECITTCCLIWHAVKYKVWWMLQNMLPDQHVWTIC